MKSKADLLKIQNDKKEKQFHEYVKIMDDVIKKNYPKGLDFDECPHVETIVHYKNIDITYYTGVNEMLIKVIKSTNEFKKIAKELIDNGYEYTFDSYIGSPHARPEWGINLIIT